MRRILNSPHAQRMIDFVAPIYGESETALWLFESIGQVLDNAAENIDSLFLQVIPQTANWSLPYWEEEYNITPDPSYDTEQRRNNIIAKIKYIAPVNPAKLEEFASAAMCVPCKVIENISKNTFRIIIHGWSGNFQRMKTLIDAAKPAHLIWNTNAKLPVIIIVEQPGKLVFQNFHIKTYINYWGCYCFNGMRRFNGDIFFDQKHGGLNMVRMHMKTYTHTPHKFYPVRLQIHPIMSSVKEKILFTVDFGKTAFCNKGSFIHSHISVYIKLPRYTTNPSIKKLYFSSVYAFHNSNGIGNASLDFIVSSRMDGSKSFNGALTFNGKTVAKTEII